jgi:hypothetical protein
LVEEEPLKGVAKRGNYNNQKRSTGLAIGIYVEREGESNSSQTHAG